MICYRDMMFCSLSDKCSNAEGCSRAVTDKVIEDATEWWGNDQNSHN